MGKILSCCCPEEDGSESGGEAYGNGSNENTPLLRDQDHQNAYAGSSVAGSEATGGQLEGRSFSDFEGAKAGTALD